MRIAWLVAVGLALLALAGPAAAQQSPFGPQPTPSQTTTVTTPTAPQPAVDTSSHDTGMSATAKTGLLAAAAVFLALIAGIIVRDARRAAPRRTRARQPVPAGKAPTAPGSRGRPTGKASAARRRRRHARR
jgi:hypothetical protein